jgi:hypothetical protein
MTITGGAFGDAMPPFRWSAGRAARRAVQAATALAALSCQKAVPTEQVAGSASAAVTAAPAATTQPSSPCTLITAAEAAAAIGVATLSPPEVQLVPPVTICKFAEGRHSGLTLRFETGRTLADMPTIRKGHDEHGQKTSDLAGLGDTAFTSSLSDLNEVSFLSKGTVVLVMARAPHEKLEALSRILISRL